MDTPKIRQIQYDLFDTARFFSLLKRIDLCERDFRLVTAAVAESETMWNLSYIADCADVSRTTLYSGVSELNGLTTDGDGNRSRRQRAEGAGRKDTLVKHPEVRDLIQKIVEPHVKGNPESPLLWVSKSHEKISASLRTFGHVVCANTVGRILSAMGYARQTCKKSHEGGSSPDRDAQFRFIERTISDFKARSLPFISVDTKKKELVGNFKNAGSDYHPKGTAPIVNVHDFVGEGGRATPYGVFDPAENTGFANVGTCADTGEFAVESIKKWWLRIGVCQYLGAKELLVLADGGGSNGSRNRLWKKSLQAFSDEFGISITVRHYPPGTSKWNKIEHGLFSFISQNWRGTPLTSVDVIVNLIRNTTSRTGLKVFAEKSSSVYQTGVKVPDSEMKKLNIAPAAFRPEWNYTISPSRQDPKNRGTAVS